jgi:hypothetical protein
LKRVDIPVLVVHRDDDQIVPIKAATLKRQILSGSIERRVTFERFSSC